MHSGSPGSFCRRLPLFCFYVFFIVHNYALDGRCVVKVIRRVVAIVWSERPLSGKMADFCRKSDRLIFNILRFSVVFWLNESSIVSLSKFNTDKAKVQRLAVKSSTFARWVFNTQKRALHIVRFFYEGNTLNGIFLVCISKNDDRKSFKNHSFFVKLFVLKSWFFKLKWGCLVKIG